MSRSGFMFLVSGLLISGRIDMATAQQRVVQTVHLASCRIKPANEVVLSVNQSGLIDFVAEEGNNVEAGQPVIRLQDDLARAALAVAEKEVSNDVDIRHAIASEDVAQTEYERLSQLGRSGVITQSELSRVKLEADRGVLLVEQTRHQHAIRLLKRDESAARLRTFSVEAPFEGTVTRVLKHKGEAVQQGEAVLEFVNTRRVRVEGFIELADRPHVVPGAAVEVALAQGGSVAASVAGHGKIVFVASVVQPVTRQVRVWAEVANENDQLLPGLTATMTINPPAQATLNASRADGQRKP